MKNVSYLKLNKNKHRKISCDFFTSMFFILFLLVGNFFGAQDVAALVQGGGGSTNIGYEIAPNLIKDIIGYGGECKRTTNPSGAPWRFISTKTSPGWLSFKNAVGRLGMTLANCPSYTYAWNVGSWPSSCGDGTCGLPINISRSVTCVRSDGVTVSDSFCSPPKPTASGTCQWSCMAQISCLSRGVTPSTIPTDGPPYSHTGSWCDTNRVKASYPGWYSSAGASCPGGSGCKPIYLGYNYTYRVQNGQSGFVSSAHWEQCRADSSVATGYSNEYIYICPGSWSIY